jgi:hypothetical protein
MPQQTVRRRLRLRALSPTLRAAFDRGQITAGVAEATARLTGVQQQSLERMLQAGEPITLQAVKEIARTRIRDATLALPGGLFGPTEAPTSWRVTVRGHLRAALDAVPGAERNGALGRTINQALTHAEGANETLHGEG